MSLRVGGLTHVICDSCGRRYRVKSVTPDDSIGLIIELMCSNRGCCQGTAMSIGMFRAYGGESRRMDIVSAKR